MVATIAAAVVRDGSYSTIALLLLALTTALFTPAVRMSIARMVFSQLSQDMSFTCTTTVAARPVEACDSPFGGAASAVAGTVTAKISPDTRRIFRQKPAEQLSGFMVSI